MPSLFGFLLRYIGWPGILLCCLYIYEEGIPGAHRIPYLSYIPIIGDLTTGRVHTYAAQQVALATKDMVTRFELNAAKAQLNIERQRAAEAILSLEAARKAYAVLSEAHRAKAAEAEKDIEDDNRNEDGAPRVTRGDLDWLHAH